MHYFTTLDLLDYEILPKHPQQRYAFFLIYASFCGIFCCLSQTRQEFDAIDRPVRHFLDARSNTRDVEQQECKGHKTRHPDDLAEDLLERYGHDGEAQRRQA